MRPRKEELDREGGRMVKVQESTRGRHISGTRRRIGLNYELHAWSKRMNEGKNG